MIPSKMKKPLLSICIPNYSRPEFLLKNLQAIVKQNIKNLEIVVSDDRSPEDIKNIIKKFQQKYPRINLRFKRQPINLGFDKNVLATVAMARGQYCWLLSNDDLILPGGINQVVKTIKQNPKTSLIVINYQRFDQILNKVTSKKMISLKNDRLFKDASKFFFYKTPESYFNILGLNTLTMSIDIFKRDLWQKEVKHLKSFIGHNFIHFFIIASIIKTNPTIYFISQPKLHYTANNHRIWSTLIWRDIRTVFLDHLLNIGYDKDSVLKLKKTLKRNDVNERIFRLSQKFPKVYNKLFPLIRKIRKFLGHHI